MAVEYMDEDPRRDSDPRYKARYLHKQMTTAKLLRSAGELPETLTVFNVAKVAGRITADAGRLARETAGWLGSGPARG